MRAFALFLAVLAAPAAAQEAQRGYIGIRPVPLNEEVRTHFKVAKGIERGLVLAEVFENSAAAKAGLRVGDVLTSFDNKPIGSIETLIERLNGMKPGRRVAYVARRGSGTIAGLLVLGKQPTGEKVSSTEIVEETPIPKPGGDLDKRMDRLTREIEELRVRAEKRKASTGLVLRTRAPRNIVGWMEAEELRIVAAKKNGDAKAAQWHAARLQMLRELRKAGFNAPNSQRRKPNAAREQSTKRMRMLEKRLDEVMERLAQLERRK